ncbi:MAG: RNA polymerase sigma factor [Candidatus Nitrospinota bacterium M3_3B_026]
MSRKDRFERYVAPHSERLFLSALRLTGNSFDAEDLMQDTLYRAYKNIDKLKDPVNPAGWLFTIMKNVHLNDIRASRRREAPLYNEERVAMIPDTAAGDPVDEMSDALGALPDEARAILVAREVQGLDYNEIAESFGLPLGTVKSRIKRAREKLREIWLETAKKRG